MALTPAERALRALTTVGIARSRDLEAVGVTRDQLRRLVAKGVLERLGRGLYRAPQSPASGLNDLARASLLVPGAVVCLLSALRFHGLTTYNPFEVWLAVRRKAWRPHLEHPPVRLIFLSGDTYTEWVEEHTIDGIRVPIFSAARTVADCFKFRNRIGTDVAVAALREYRRVHPKGLDLLWQAATANRVSEVMRPYLEAGG